MNQIDKELKLGKYAKLAINAPEKREESKVEDEPIHFQSIYSEKTFKMVQNMLKTQGVVAIFESLRHRIPLRTLYNWKTKRSNSNNYQNCGRRTNLKPLEDILF